MHNKNQLYIILILFGEKNEQDTPSKSHTIGAVLLSSSFFAMLLQAVLFFCCVSFVFSYFLYLYDLQPLRVDFVNPPPLTQGRLFAAPLGKGSWRKTPEGLLRNAEFEIVTTPPPQAVPLPLTQGKLKGRKLLAYRLFY